MYYNGTVEANVYRALRERINLFVDMIGRLQPILATINREIAKEALEGGDVIYKVIHMIDEADTVPSFDLGAMLAAETAQYEPPESPVTMEDLDRIAGSAYFMRQYETEQAGRRQYNLSPSAGKPVRVTTDRKQFEAHGDSMEFWSPGSPAFPALGSPSDILKYDTLKQLLDSMEPPR